MNKRGGALRVRGPHMVRQSTFRREVYGTLWVPEKAAFRLRGTRFERAYA